MTLEDRAAIQDLLSRYCQYTDSADQAGWVGLFTEDGSMDLGMGDPPFVGREALGAFSSRLRAGGGLHMSANPVIEQDGDEASVASYVVVVGGEDDPRVRLGGRYLDRLRRVDGDWRFASRQLVVQMRQKA